MSMPCMQEGRIARIEAGIEKMSEMISSLIPEIRDLNTKITSLALSVKDHQSILYGEGGESGLISKANESKRSVDELQVAMKGYGEEPGLIALIKEIAKKIEDEKDDKKWLNRLVLGWVILAVAELLISLIK